MKKLFALLLTLSIITCVLGGCAFLDDFISDISDGENSNIDNTDEDSLPEGYYSVKVTGSKSSLMKKIKKSYKAGTLVQIKAYPVTDVTLHIFVNGEEIPMYHFDSDYWGYQFIMPEEDVTIHLTYDQFYGKEEYGFDELYVYMMYLEKYGDSINKICTRTYNTDERYSLVENRYSSKEVDIENFKDIFNQRLLKVDDNEILDTSIETSYTFFYEDSGFGELYFYDNYYHWNDFSSFQIFKFKDESYSIPVIENPDLITYSFIYDGLSSDIKKYGDDSFSERFFNIDDIEFVPYEGEKIDTQPEYYVDSRYGIIKLITATIFELNGEYYEILSGENYWAYKYCK